MRYFELINEAGIPQAKLNDLVQADDDTRKKMWRDLIETAYAPILGDLDLPRATSGQLQEKFAAIGMSGETLRKATTFFVAGADDSGIAMSPQLKPNTRGLSGGTRKRKPKPISKANDAGLDNEERQIAPPAGKGTSATLLLDVEGNRKITLHGPPSITAAELERLKSWVAVQFIVA